ncbi:MAG: ThiF family adenylyltransferase [Gemmatimonadetes bacterium]|nr:ThiF family adenylyltransferase [Gemmatimonadota bacterium]MYJ18559.1 ThiF family adenylyltransferase [Gemmatimonadota bacterium]
MTVTLVVPAPITATAKRMLRANVETGAVLGARIVQTEGGNLRLLAIGIWEVPQDAYLLQRSDELVVASHGFIPPLAEIEAAGGMAIWVHTHPGDGASPRPSERDFEVDRRLSEVFRLRTGAPFYGALVLSSDGEDIRFAGHIDDGETRTSIDRLWLVGPELRLRWHDERPERPGPGAKYDRQIRAFGAHIQKVVGQLSIAVVGCGGTGSAVAEQLVRMGARKLDLYDPDHVSSSNLTRLYGSHPPDIGRAKTDVVAEHLRSIAPQAQIGTHVSAITTESVARHLMDADIVFGCTDDNAGRLVLSRFSTYFLTPVVDVGVLLTSSARGTIDGIHGRVTVLHPGGACLVCRGRVDLQRAAVELRSSAERASLAAEGYAPAMPGVEPAVVSFTSWVAAVAVSELLERLIHYGPRPVPNEILIRAHDREMSTNHAEPRAGHYCSPDGAQWGLGVTVPFLDQTWTR